MKSAAPVKPSNIVYAVNERPPLSTVLLMGLQHTSVFFISIIFPVIIVHEMGSAVSTRDANSFVALSILAGGLVTIFQACRKGPVGSGYLCPSVCGPSYFQATRFAALSSGLPLVFGMTALAGVFEIGFSRFMHKLKFMFPSEVTGVAVTMVGIVLVPISMRNFLVIHDQNLIGTPQELTVAIFTLASMIILNVFGKGVLRLYCSLIGIVIGYLLALALGLFNVQDVAQFSSAKLFDIPYIRNMSWRIDFTMIVPFLVATLCSTLKTVGDLVTCQKINNADWRAPDMKSVSGGIFADGLGGLVPGLIGGYGQSTSSTNVGLSLASGVTSRVVAFSMGGLLILLAFFPKVSTIFLIMPKPVMGAVLLFAASFMIIAGLQIITSRLLDARKTFVVGLSLTLGLSVDMMPGIYDHFHPWLKPVFDSSLALATISAVVLNLLLRIGIAKKRTLVFRASPGANQKLSDFIQESGKAWGALKDVMDKAKNSVVELNEALVLSGIKKDVSLTASFDELSVVVDISYDGPPMPGSDHQNRDWLKAGDSDFVRLAMSIVRYHADRLTVSGKQGTSRYRIYFDHA